MKISSQLAHVSVLWPNLYMSLTLSWAEHKLEDRELDNLLISKLFMVKRDASPRKKNLLTRQKFKLSSVQNQQRGSSLVRQAVP